MDINTKNLLANLYARSGFKTLDGKELKVSTNNDEYLDYYSSFAPTIELLSDINKQSSYIQNSLFKNEAEYLSFLRKNNERGGAPTQRKRSNSKEKCPDKKMITRPSDLETITKEIMKELIQSHSYYKDANGIKSINDINVITSIARSKGYLLTDSDYEFIMRYLESNLMNNFKAKYMNSHSLMHIVNYRGSYEVFLNKEIDFGIFNNFRHDEKMLITRAASEDWIDVSAFMNTGYYSDIYEHPVDPIFMLLFGTKLAGFEDICVLQDYVSMVKQIRDNNVSPKNFTLAMLRIFDVSKLNTRNPAYDNPVNNELLRISISMLLREICYTIRNGRFCTPASRHLMNLLKDIVVCGSHFEEENLISAILGTFSFKPTLVSPTKYKTGINQIINTNYSHNIGLQTSQILEPPRAVYTLHYPILDSYVLSQLNVERPVLDNHTFTSMGFDPNNNKVIFITSPQNQPTSSEAILQNILNILNTQKVEANFTDIISTVSANATSLSFLYKDLTSVQMFLTNGMFVVSIPRIQYINGCHGAQNIFYRKTVNKTINITEIEIKDSITVNNISYVLKGALCYDLVETSCMLNPINNISVNYTNKIGTFAVLKAGEYWIKYNPNDLILAKRKEEFIERAVRNAYNKEYPLLGEVTFDEYKNTPAAKEIVKNINAFKVNIQNMIITKKEALTLIGSRACLLFYSEPYDHYKSRLCDN